MSELESLEEIKTKTLPINPEEKEAKGLLEEEGKKNKEENLILGKNISNESLKKGNDVKKKNDFFVKGKKRKNKDNEDVETKKKIKYNGQKVKEWTKRESDGEEKEEKKPKKKVALLMGYCGTGYQGMQINPNAESIENELHKALAASGAVSKDNAMAPHKIGFMRAARTDKGVHAAGQVCSLKMIVEDEDVIKKINENLPKQIRVYGYVPTTGGFHAKFQCDSRIYEYLMPTYVLQQSNPALFPYSAIAEGLEIDLESNQPIYNEKSGQYIFKNSSPITAEEMIEKRKFRVSEEILEELRVILKCYKGTFNFHNFTIGKAFKEKNANRFIKSFECSKPFIRQNSEWVSLKVHGQSFMLHQIRKMVGLAIMIIRTKTPHKIITNLFKDVKVNTPKAPSLGLLLEQAIFEAYNNKLKGVTKSDKRPVNFEKYKEEMNTLKEEWIYSKIINEELETNEFEKWIRIIESHSMEFSWWLKKDGEIDLKLKPASLKEMGRGLLEKEEEEEEDVEED
ncbi:tRNA pseudouridine synthase 1 [Clydaea vesicula]|uniref:tRNA pseudouridine synthase 1 n=1 Tax=Clydaea vesicula TaxID=447962 RepID=A0AAD5Y343_9FUNG|nr:tRNA pseudouridine synthase 1 [Clydaea vesicula]